MGISAALGSSALLPAGLGFRNVIINGDMGIAQRATTAGSITGAGYHTVDRWTFNVDSAGTWTMSQENDGPPGFRKSAKVLCTVANTLAAGDNLTFLQRIEGVNAQGFNKGSTAARPFALSFWVKSNVTGTYIVELYDIDNTRQVSASYTISSSGTWEYKTIMLPIDASGLLDYDNNNSLQCTFWLTAGSTFSSGTLNTSWASATNANRAVGQVHLAAAVNNYWQVTGVQLEANYQPTPFEERPYGVELQLCQRYFYAPNETDNNGYSHYGLGFAYSTTQAFFAINTPVQMRVPITSSRVSYSTLRVSDTVGAWAITAISVSDFTKNRNAIQVDATIGSASLTAFRPALVQGNNSTSAYFRFDAEL